MEALFKGQKGDKGEPGVSRLPRVQGWAIVAMVVIVLLIDGVLLFWQSHETNVNNRAQHQSEQVIEAKLCRTLNGLAALKPPSGPAAANPARAFEQRQHLAFTELAADLGCNGKAT